MPVLRWSAPLRAALAVALACVAAVPAPAMSAQSRFVGTYYAVRAGADSLQDLTLTLQPSGAAELITRYPGITKTAAGVIVYPYLEKGTWKAAKDGSIDVDLTRAGKLLDVGTWVDVLADNTRVGLRLTGPILATVRDRNRSFGSAGLLFRKSDCR